MVPVPAPTPARALTRTLTRTQTPNPNPTNPTNPNPNPNPTQVIAEHTKVISSFVDTSESKFGQIALKTLFEAACVHMGPEQP